MLHVYMELAFWLHDEGVEWQVIGVMGMTFTQTTALVIGQLYLKGVMTDGTVGQEQLVYDQGDLAVGIEIIGAQI